MWLWVMVERGAGSLHGGIEVSCRIKLTASIHSHSQLTGPWQDGVMNELADVLYSTPTPHDFELTAHILTW